MKRLNKKGFTMAELLIVVAIIAVLVAIAIPIFTAQLEKSREATDLANLRAAYAECSTAVINEASDTATGVTYSSGTATKKVVLKQKEADWQTASIDVAGITDKTQIPSSGTVTVSVSSSGVTFTTTTP